MVRVKGKLTAFDGTVMRLELPPAKGSKNGEEITLAVTPETRYAGTSPGTFGAIKPGDYVGAAVSEQRGGALRAQDVYIYAEAMRGSGEGRFPEGDRLIINGTVTAVKAADNGQSGTLTLHYRGAVLTGTGLGRTICEGRAAPPAFASALSCQADAVVEVRPGTAISALVIGTKALLQPGAFVTVSATKSDDGKNIALGLVVEPPPPNPAVEKPTATP